MAVAVRDDPDESRYEVRVDGELAGFTVYERHGDRLAFTHTETLPAFSGRGLATQLVQETLDDVRARELRVLPFCPFVQRFIVEHPDYQDLVPAHRRERFGLPADGSTDT